jgi:hypothetical protein
MIEQDAYLLAKQIEKDFPPGNPLQDAVWWSSPATRVIDCVLSLGINYERVVVPRVRAFTERRPKTTSCESLLRLIDEYDSPLAFQSTELNLRHTRKATALVGVLQYLVDIQKRFPGDEEIDRLGHWATWARPGDYLAVDAPGFALAGFQYLRMLFGAETVKPDTHILSYAESVLGRVITGNQRAEVAAIYSFERAGELLNRSVRQMDVSIWELRSGRTHPGRTS